jgi:SagB-type dehydrogenase family enzyme
VQPERAADSSVSAALAYHEATFGEIQAHGASWLTSFLFTCSRRSANPVSQSTEGYAVSLSEPLYDVVQPSELLSSRQLKYILRVGLGHTGPGGARAFPSAGGMYPNDAYAIIGSIRGLSAGVYLFDAARTDLALVRAGDHRRALASALACEAVAEAPVTLVLVGNLRLSAVRYGIHCFRNVAWDAGSMAATVLLLTCQLGVQVDLVTAFIDAAVMAELSLADEQAVPLAALVLGSRSAATPHREIGRPRKTNGLPAGSQDPVTAIRTAARLTDKESVQSIRLRLRSLGRETVAVQPMSSLVEGEDVARVLARRSSARRFDPAPITIEELEYVVSAAGAGRAQDSRIRVRPYVLIQNVHGRKAGAYRLVDGNLCMLRAFNPGAFSVRESRGQDIARDAAAVLYWGGDLAQACQEIGDRAYQMEMIEAGLCTGLAYFAAYKRRLGARALICGPRTGALISGDTSLVALLSVAIGRSRSKGEMAGVS